MCGERVSASARNGMCENPPGGPPPPPAQDDTAATKKYKGVHFGNLKSLRTQFKGKASGVIHACRLLILTHTSHTHVHTCSYPREGWPWTWRLWSLSRQWTELTGQGTMCVAADCVVNSSQNPTVVHVCADWMSTIYIYIYKENKKCKRCRDGMPKSVANKVGMMHESKGQRIEKNGTFATAHFCI